MKSERVQCRLQWFAPAAIASAGHLISSLISDDKGKGSATDLHREKLGKRHHDALSNLQVSTTPAEPRTHFAIDSRDYHVRVI